MYIGCIYRRVYLYWRWSGKGLRVSIGLQNKRLALKPSTPPSCSKQSSLALEYSFTHLALACLSIRYVMYPGSTPTSCIALFLLLSYLPFLSSPFVPLLCASRHVRSHRPTQVRKIKERLLHPNLHPYRTRVYTSENSPSRRIVYFPDFREDFFLNTLS